MNNAHQIKSALGFSKTPFKCTLSNPLNIVTERRTLWTLFNKYWIQVKSRQWPWNSKPHFTKKAKFSHKEGLEKTVFDDSVHNCFFAFGDFAISNDRLFSTYICGLVGLIQLLLRIWCSSFLLFMQSDGLIPQFLLSRITERRSLEILAFTHFWIWACLHFFVQ